MAEISVTKLREIQDALEYASTDETIIGKEQRERAMKQGMALAYEVFEMRVAAGDARRPGVKLVDFEELEGVE